MIFYSLPSRLPQTSLARSVHGAVRVWVGHFSTKQNPASRNNLLSPPWWCLTLCSNLGVPFWSTKGSARSSWCLGTRVCNQFKIQQEQDLQFIVIMCRVPLIQGSCKYRGSLGLIPRTFWKYHCLYSKQNTLLFHSISVLWRRMLWGMKSIALWLGLDLEERNRLWSGV